MSDRSTDLTIYGTNDFSDTGVIENLTTNSNLANIIELSSQDNHVYNDGVINYTTRYIQKSVGSIKQASMIDNDRNWIYKPVLLWEVSGTQNTKSVNAEADFPRLLA